jgi:sodium-coupled monocarboxylate transporter 8/12
MNNPSVGVFDYFILVTVLLGSVLIGLFHGFTKTAHKYFSFLKVNNRVETDPGDLELMQDEINETSTRTIPRDPQPTLQSEQTQVSNYLTANASMSSIPVAFSILATYTSTTSILGTPAEVYQYGVQVIVSGLGYSMPSIIAAYVTLPFLAKLNIISVFEYIQKRYDTNTVRTVGMLSYALKNSSACALFILGPSTALSLLLGMDQNVSIGLICVIGTFYTCVGGIRAVIWTDMFQLCVMLASILSVIGKGVYDVGGVNEIWSLNERGGRLNFLDFDPNPLKRQSFWSLFFGCWAFATCALCFDQNMLQRYKASRSDRQARNSILLNMIGIMISTILCTTSGMVVYAAYATCDPLITKKINGPNQYISYFVLNHLHMMPGFVGLFLSSVFCSSLSSVSSFLNSLAAIIWKDLLLLFPYFQAFDDSRALEVNRLIVVVCGVICSFYAYVLSLSGSNLLQLTSIIAGVFNSPLSGLFILSMFFSCVNEKGAIGGVVVGLGLNLWVSMGAFMVGPVYPKLSVSVAECANGTVPLGLELNSSTTITYDHLESHFTGLDNIYKLSFYWYAAFGIFNTVFFGLVISLLTGGLKNKVNESLLIYDLAKFIKRK